MLHTLYLVVLCPTLTLAQDPMPCRTDLVYGSCVFGSAYKVKVVADEDECCDLCGNDNACVAWNLNGNDTHKNCALKNESSVGKRGGSCLANGMTDPPPSPGPPPAGKYATKYDTFMLPNGWMCGSDAPTAIVYPAQLEEGPFPIASFGHGSGGSMLLPLLEQVASLGFVVVAPKTACCNDHGQDILHALDWTRTNASLHEALQHVDYSRAGIFGHSFGSAWATDAVHRAMEDPKKYNVKAAVFSHGGSDAGGIAIPSMFATGRGGGADWGMYESCPADHKVFVHVAGAGHMEPIQGGRMNPFDAHFLGCHVANLKVSCDKIYGDGDDSVCKANPMDGCDITGSNPMESVLTV